MPRPADSGPEDTPLWPAPLEKQIALLERLVTGSSPARILVAGPSGSGKTSAIEIVRRHSEAGMLWVEVDCFTVTTAASVFAEISRRALRFLGTAGLGKGAVDALSGGLLEWKTRLDRLTHKHRCVIVLDHLDTMPVREAERLLYNLAALRCLSMVFVTQSTSFLSRLNPVVTSRINPVVVRFEPYDIDALCRIASLHAEKLRLEVDDEYLRTLAQQAHGNAHLVVNALRKAELVGSVAACDAWWQAVDGIGTHERLLLEAVGKHQPVRTPALWRAYRALCSSAGVEPLKERTLRDVLVRLERRGLVSVSRSRPREPATVTLSHAAR